MDLTYNQLQEIMAFFGDPDPDYPERTVSVVECDGIIYAYDSEYPEEGSIQLG